MPGLPQAVFGLPQIAFDGLINANSVRLLWKKSHTCPCIASGTGLNATASPGAGKPQCNTCKGLGIYWDNAIGPFNGLISFMSMTRTPDEPGAKLDEVRGPVLSGSPNITVSQSANSTVWAEASENDQFIEMDAPARFNAILTEGFQNYVPFFEDLSIASAGAVTTWDSINNIVLPVTGYTISGNKVTSGLPLGTPFTVEFQATNIYLIARKPGGQAHIRPFGNAQGQLLPRRFQGQQVDYWIRARMAQADEVAGQTNTVSGSTFVPVTTVGQV